MDEEEHEVYGQEIPVDADMEGADVDMTGGGDDAAKVPPAPTPTPPGSLSPR
jgi:polyadenylate-binding protein 2